jgi:general secretion pathway protein H
MRGARTYEKSPVGVDGGYTLLELLVVMAIIAVVSGVTAANFSGSSEGAKLRAESRKLISHMRYTRVRALSESQVFSVVVDSDGRAYQVTPGDEMIALPDPLVMSLSSLNEGPEFYAGKIAFYPDGSSSGGMITLTAPFGDSVIHVNWMTGEVAHAPE